MTANDSEERPIVPAISGNRSESGMWSFAEERCVVGVCRSVAGETRCCAPTPGSRVCQTGPKRPPASNREPSQILGNRHGPRRRQDSRRQPGCLSALRDSDGGIPTDWSFAVFKHPTNGQCGSENGVSAPPSASLTCNRIPRCHCMVVWSLVPRPGNPASNSRPRPPPRSTIQLVQPCLNDVPHGTVENSFPHRM